MVAVIEILFSLCVISVLVALIMFFWLWAWDLYKRLRRGDTRTEG